MRLKALGHSKTEVARLTKIDRATVRKYWNGLAPDSISIEPTWTNQIDWEYLNEEMKKVSKKILYAEQKDIIDLPSYQAFCEYIRKHKKTSLPETTIKIHRAPGSSVEVDYSGDGIQIINPGTGEIYTAQLFVGTLSFSGYFYGEFTLTQKLEDFIGAHKNMFSFFGGITKYIVPDNCKTAIIKNNKMDPIVHPTYQVRPQGWGALFGDKVIAEAISDRLMASSQTIDVKGESFWPTQGTKNKLENEEN